MTPTLQLVLALAILILAAKAGGLVSTRLKQPAVLGQLLVGLLLGPSLLGFFQLPIFAGSHTEEIVLEFAELGVIFLMFMAGLEVDLGEMLGTGRIALLAGSLGVVAPLLLGAALMLLFGFPLVESLFVGLILTATSVSISAQTLFELGALKRREGVALLGAAVVDDVLVTLVLSVMLALLGAGDSNPEVPIVFIRMILFFALALGVGLYLIPRLTHWIERLPISEGVIAWSIVLTLLFAWSAEMLGQVAGITGAFLAGLFVGRSRVRQQVVEGMHTLTYGFFVPLFLVSIGLKTDTHSLDVGEWGLLVGIILVAIFSKVLGAGLGAWLAGMTQAESLRVGVGMISRGEVGLIVAGVELQRHIISADIYAEMVIMVLVTTLVTPFWLRRLFPNGEA